MQCVYMYILCMYVPVYVCMHVRTMSIRHLHGPSMRQLHYIQLHVASA